MIGKMVLPRLGGTPAVWNTCMVFFQAMLLVGCVTGCAVLVWRTPEPNGTLVELPPVSEPPAAVAAPAELATAVTSGPAPATKRRGVRLPAASPTVLPRPGARLAVGQPERP